MKTLKEDLKNIGITLYPYNPEKGLRCSIFLTDFYEGKVDISDEDIEKDVTKSIKDKFANILGANKIGDLKVTPIVKRRDVPDADSEKGFKTEVKIKAMAEF